MTAASISKTNAKSLGSLGLSSDFVQVMEELGFSAPTPIQSMAVPVLLAGGDVIGQAKTGSGKTAAFSLPILQKIALDKEDIQAVILCPTRELCAQVAREVRRLGRKLPGLHVLVLAGGQPVRTQMASYEQGAHIVVGTPGRVLDLLGREKISFKEIKTLVLDEADRMLDMGFQEQMEEIFRHTPKSRQTCFFSATFPATIEQLSRVYQKNPARIELERTEDALPAIQEFAAESGIDVSQKTKALLAFLEFHKPESGIVFCNLKATVAELAASLRKCGISADGLHGDLEQRDRDRVMAKFRNHSVSILVATDVAARGIDVPDVDLVFNFDFVVKPEVYVHRIGRTARAGKKGLAISLISPREKLKLQNLEEFLGRTLPKKNIPPRQRAVGAEASREGAPKAAEASSSFAQSAAVMQTLYVSGGRKAKLRPGDILGALTGEAGGLQGSDIGKIEIHDNFSYVAVARTVAGLAVQRLQAGKIKGRKFAVDLVR